MGAPPKTVAPIIGKNGWLRNGKRVFALRPRSTFGPLLVQGYAGTLEKHNQLVWFTKDGREWNHDIYASDWDLVRVDD